MDQGGCVETIKPTTHENPTYFVDGILHYAVANMPGGVPRTSTLALTNATLPYGLKLAKQGWRAACKADPALRLGLNVVEGKVVYPGRGRGVPAPADRRRLRPLIRGPDHPAAPRRGPAAAQPGHAGLRRLRRRQRGGRRSWRRWSGRLFRTGFAIAVPDGLRVPDPAAVGPGAQARHHAAQHAGDDRQRLPRRADDHRW